ncbi:ABC transporter ATP-binding protein [Methylocapsa aurea]|uniref:ABC transporter ATP-binding protein n=1 Tax=Methylocapsa aurea TaxID=663610 RepID=UPI0005669FE6|nr:ABC transporter ATP-binding protein [Methylocapsa aurea]
MSSTHDSSAPFVQLEGVTKRHGGVAAVDALSLTLRRGEFFALLGPSGCGKTSLLRLIAGFETPDEGRIFIDGEDVTGTPPHRRPVNMMFQTYALFPHMNVARNIGFGLVQEGIARAEIARRVTEMLRLVQLEGLGERRPDQLSGGQKQRVALARALVKRPKLLLLDEPLAALDRRLREETQFELMHLQERLGATFLVVTHDQREAMVMASRIGVMRAGRIEQIGAPAEIYERPISSYVAQFIGEINLIEGVVKGQSAEGPLAEARSGLLGVSIAAGLIDVACAVAHAPGSRVAIAVRPERIRVAPLDRAQEFPNVLTGEIEESAYLGDMTLYRVRLAGGLVLRAAHQNARPGAHSFESGDRVAASFAPDAGIVLPA